MAVRRPIYYNSGNIYQMTDAMINQIRDQAIHMYAISPSVQLSVIGVGGNLGTINDTRLVAGAVATSISAIPSEAVTQEPFYISITYNRINQTIVSTSDPANTDSVAFPAYLTANNNIQAMSAQDVYDTFIYPAIDLLTLGTTTAAQAGTYRIHTAQTLTGHTLVSTTPVFTDTRANTSLYTAVPEDQDQPQTIQNYYLMLINSSSTGYTLPVKVRSDGNIQQYDTTAFNNLLQTFINRSAAVDPNYKISYSLITGLNRGSGMVNTALTGGSGIYNSNQFGPDDYRAQEFPNGTPTVINATFLKINKGTV
jgi:hypothetical protein